VTSRPAPHVLYLSYGIPKKAVSEEVEDGVVAHYDARTHDLVGITILRFAKRFGPDQKAVSVPARIA
jgi:hypothetical protein